MSTLRYGLIGTGQMGHNHIDVVEHLEDADIVAVADTFAGSRQRARESLGSSVAVHESHAELLNRETLDAVLIATPDDTHADIVCDCLATGVHVLAEKPMATTVEDCGRILSAATAADGIYQVGLELRYAAIWQKLHSLVREGTIGEIRQLWCKEFRGPWGLKVGQWITQQARTGGALVEKNCHHFDLFNWVIGRPPRRVAAFGSCDLVYGPERFEGVTPDVLDNAQILVEYEGGALATLMLCMYCTGYREGLEIGVVGRDGWIIATTGKANSMRISRREGGPPEQVQFELPEEIRRTSHGGAVYLEHLAFLENIRNGSQALTDAHVAWWASVLPILAERAVAEKRIIEFTEAGDLPTFPC